MIILNIDFLKVEIFKIISNFNNFKSDLSINFI